MKDLNVWGYWHLEKREWVGGISVDNPIWSFNKRELESQLLPPESFVMEVRAMDDIDIAKIPEAASAFVSWLHIQEARERLEKIRGQAE